VHRRASYPPHGAAHNADLFAHNNIEKRAIRLWPKPEIRN
jgi:hypothetical protein